MRGVGGGGGECRHCRLSFMLLPQVQVRHLGLRHSQPQRLCWYPPVPRAKHCRLQEAAREAEEEGERLLAQLGAGELGVEAFVGGYTKTQATYHQRDLKLQAAQQTLPGVGPH